MCTSKSKNSLTSTYACRAARASYALSSLTLCTSFSTCTATKAYCALSAQAYSIYAIPCSQATSTQRLSRLALTMSMSSAGPWLFPFTYTYIYNPCTSAYVGAYAGIGPRPLLAYARCPCSPCCAPYAGGGIITTYPPSPTPSPSLHAYSTRGGAPCTISLIHWCSTHHCA